MVTTSRVAVPPASRRPLPVWVRHLVAVFVWAFVIGLALYFFDSITLVFLDLLAAAAIAAMLRPVVGWLPNRWPNWVKGAIVGLGFIILVAAILTGLGWLLSKPIDRELKQWPTIKQHLNDMLVHWSYKLGLAQPLTVDPMLRRILVFATGGGTTTAGGATGAAAVGRVLGRTADIAIRVLVTLALVFIGQVYILVEPRGRLVRPLARMMPPRRGLDLHATFHDLQWRLRWWLIGVFISMAIIGTLSWVGYWIVGLQFALPLAIFAGVAEIVPNIGALTAMGVAVLVAATQSTGVLIGVLVVHCITLFIESHFIMPVVMRGAVNLPPLVSIFSVVLWAEIFGFGGLLLAIPLDLLIWTAAEHFLLHPTADDPRLIEAAESRDASPGADVTRSEPRG